VSQASVFALLWPPLSASIVSMSGTAVKSSQARFWFHVALARHSWSAQHRTCTPGMLHGVFQHTSCAGCKGALGCFLPSSVPSIKQSVSGGWSEP
jgi:hypothetical protein